MALISKLKSFCRHTKLGEVRTARRGDPNSHRDGVEGGPNSPGWVRTDRGRGEWSGQPPGGGSDPEGGDGRKRHRPPQGVGWPIQAYLGSRSGFNTWILNSWPPAGLPLPPLDCCVVLCGMVATSGKSATKKNSQTDQREYSADGEVTDNVRADVFKKMGDKFVRTTVIKQVELLRPYTTETFCCFPICLGVKGAIHATGASTTLLRYLQSPQHVFIEDGRTRHAHPNGLESHKSDAVRPIAEP